jgi:hypothetical protein
LSIVRHCKDYKIRRFGNRISFRAHVRMRRYLIFSVPRKDFPKRVFFLVFRISDDGRSVRKLKLSDFECYTLSLEPFRIHILLTNLQREIPQLMKNPPLSFPSFSPGRLLGTYTTTSSIAPSCSVSLPRLLYPSIEPEPNRSVVEELKKNNGRKTAWV